MGPWMIRSSLLAAVTVAVTLATLVANLSSGAEAYAQARRSAIAGQYETKARATGQSAIPEAGR